jgi:hypothetical protein
VGILGGIIRETNVEKILQLDLLKTDYFHAEAYPTYLYYNPYSSTKTVEIDVGPRRGIFTTPSAINYPKECSGSPRITHPVRHREIVVLAPAGGNAFAKAKRIVIDERHR